VEKRGDETPTLSFTLFEETKKRHIQRDASAAKPEKERLREIAYSRGYWSKKKKKMSAEMSAFFGKQDQNPK